MVREVYKAMPKGLNEATARSGSPQPSELGTGAVPEGERMVRSERENLTKESPDM